MATERVTERPDGATERVVERGGTTYVDRGGSGLGGVIIGIAVLALVAIVAFFLMTQSRNDTVRTSAVTGAASSVANSASRAADSVGNAAGNAADTANPSK
jgi:hypothetical protein